MRICHYTPIKILDVGEINKRFDQLYRQTCFLAGVEGGGSITFAQLVSKPTTLAGYGITDASLSSHTHTFASLTSVPTTILGYGITDGVSLTGIQTLTNKTLILPIVNKLNITTGANSSVGTATLVSGTVIVSTTLVATDSIIFVSLNTPGGTLGIGYSAPVASIVDATSFVINSVAAAGTVVTTDTSSVNYWIINS